MHSVPQNRGNSSQIIFHWIINHQIKSSNHLFVSRDGVTFTHFCPIPGYRIRKRFLLDLSSQIDNKLLFEGTESLFTTTRPISVTWPGYYWKAGSMSSTQLSNQTAFRLPVLNLVGSGHTSLSQKKRIDHVFTIYQKSNNMVAGIPTSVLRQTQLMLPGHYPLFHSITTNLRLQMNIRNDLPNYFQGHRTKFIRLFRSFASDLLFVVNMFLTTVILQMINLRERMAGKILYWRIKNEHFWRF